MSLYLVFQGFKMLLSSESGAFYSHLLFVCLNCLWTTRQSSHQVRYSTGIYEVNNYPKIF